MFTTKSGEKIFVVDAHVHLWDGSPENQKNIHGKQFIDCFYDYHLMSPKEYVWPYEKYVKYTEADFEKDVFGDRRQVDLFVHRQPALVAGDQAPGLRRYVPDSGRVL